jgi:hypothetical protein
MRPFIELRQERMRVLCRQIRICMVALTFLLCAIVSQGALAQVTEWSISKQEIHRQTISNTPPGAPIAWKVESVMTVVASTDFSAVTLNGVHSYTLNGIDWVFVKIYPDKASLDADFPPSSSVAVSATGNTQPSVSQTIPLGPDNYPFVPYFTGTTYDDLQGMDATSQLTVTFTSADSAGMILGIIDIIEDPQNTNILLLTQNFLFAQNSTQIPSNFFKPDASYQLAIWFQNSTTLAADPAGFNRTTSVRYKSFTLVDFSTSTRNPDLNGDGIVDGADLGLLLGAWGTSP